MYTKENKIFTMVPYVQTQSKMVSIYPLLSIRVEEYANSSHELDIYWSETQVRNERQDGAILNNISSRFSIALYYCGFIVR